MEDIRWEQRFSNFKKALNKLLENIEYIKSEEELDDDLEYDEVNDLLLATADIVKQGLIQSFEFTYELAWKVMQDYAEYQGNTDITGSRDAIRIAARTSLISKANLWMEMIESRNSTSHTYNEETANEIAKFVLVDYVKLFVDFDKKMEELRSGKQGELFG
ncbi:nucleotidyltransferase substrate binding protein [Chryseobacterium sediminis]|uniref:nucleotidyltransferase substrate binding protein n=1 Tax=Chryseobacterium sediminis TaxID=1679494 RepID=UPI0028633F9D|nr:nucleotidyltransferase substrate binding protein [Chryseobacterium sediminis]MDR6462678.1 nucleotidyltransferase substrate binding protein (TIGR01987 family) [Chryseobacterium sediminis]